MLHMQEARRVRSLRRPHRIGLAVAGGGPTGVEIAGQIREVATRTLANEFHSIDPEDALRRTAVAWRAALVAAESAG